VKKQAVSCIAIDNDSFNQVQLSFSWQTFVGNQISKEAECSFNTILSV
jgi:hypothetical protein